MTSVFPLVSNKKRKLPPVTIRRTPPDCNHDVGRVAGGFGHRLRAETTPPALVTDAAKDQSIGSADRAMRTDAQRKYNRLVVAVRKVFATLDGDASMEAIARQAGVGAGTLYRHFPKRIDLVEAVYRNDVEETDARRAPRDSWAPSPHLWRKFSPLDGVQFAGVQFIRWPLSTTSSPASAVPGSDRSPGTRAGLWRSRRPAGPEAEQPTALTSSLARSVTNTIL